MSWVLSLELVGFAARARRLAAAVEVHCTALVCAVWCVLALAVVWAEKLLVLLLPLRQVAPRDMAMCCSLVVSSLRRSSWA